jgi:uncharacterized protein YbcI
MAMIARTQGQIEHELRELIVRFKKVFLSQGPSETDVTLLKNRVLICCKSTLSPAEWELVQTPQGALALKQLRWQLIDLGRQQLEDRFQAVLGVAVRTLHFDLCTVTGESVLLISLSEPVDVINAQG